jgi:hypothetical protein
MNSKQLNLILGASAVFASHLAFAQGHGSGGGGQVVQTASGYELRDLIAKTCINQDGVSMIDSMPELRGRLDAIKKVHWYFGFALERELQSMNFCFTDADFNPLMLPRVDGPKSLLLVTAPGSTQFVAVRIFESKEAYIKNQLYNRLSARSKAMTLIHETLHSFIPLNVADRNIRLRDFVNVLSSLDPSQASSAAELDSAMRFSRIQFPSRSSVQAQSKYLEFVFGTASKQRSALLSGAMTVQQLLNPPRINFAGDLLEQDRAFLTSISGREPEVFLAPYCEADDQAVIAKLRAQNTDQFDVDLFCFATQAGQGQLKEAPSATTIGAAKKKLGLFYTGILNSEFRVHRDRILVSGGVRVLSQANGNPANSTTALSLRPIQSFAHDAELSGETRIWMNLLVSLARYLGPNDWAAIVGKEGLAKQALNSAQLTQKVEALTGAFEDEKRALIKTIPDLVQSFRQAVESELRQGGFDAHADAWKQLLTQN